MDEECWEHQVDSNKVTTIIRNIVAFREQVLKTSMYAIDMAHINPAHAWNWGPLLQAAGIKWTADKTVKAGNVRYRR